MRLFLLRVLIICNITLQNKLANEKLNVLDAKLGFPNYLNTLNSFRNPDIMTGDPRQFLKGNKYRAKMVKEEDEKQEMNESITEILKLDEENENGKEEEKSDKGSDKESDDDLTLPNRYFIKDSNSIRCRNCKEMGHMARNCPNEQRLPSCKFCGLEHGYDDK